jgi:hypothetical protein
MNLASILFFVEKHKIKLTLGIGIVAGLALGLLIGWGIWPKAVTNQTPAYLRGDFQRQYLYMVADRYAQSNYSNLAEAQSLLGLAIPPTPDTPWINNPSLLYQAIESASAKADPTRQQELTQLRTALFQPNSQTALATILEPEKVDSPNYLGICGLALFVILLVAGLFFLVTRWMGRRTGTKSAASEAYGVPVIDAEPTEEMRAAGETTPPVTAFTASYVLGDDYFDPSFSIEVGPDFLGECGVGVSESIGIGDPKKITAFEVWLFDKSDIRTVTTVLASDYAFVDPNMHSKLAPKGDVVKIQPGTEIVLETTALRIRAYVKTAEYAQGNLPPNSFFQKVSIELRAWVKQ